MMTEKRLKDYRAVKAEVKHLEELRARFANVYGGPLTEIVELYDQKIAEGRAELQAVEEAINALPDVCREICQLHYIQGLTLEAITWRVNYSIQSVNRYKKKALSLL